jgi:Glycosyl transferases group 1
VARRGATHARTNPPSAGRQLLVFDCHEAWVYQLRWLDQAIDVIVGLKGRHTTGWDEHMRPVPPNARLVTLPEALAATTPYDCIIAHSLADLLDVKSLAAPRLFVVHATLEGMILDQHSKTPIEEMRHAAAQYVDLAGAHAIAVSSLKARSWGIESESLPFSADTADYPPYRGDLACGLRIANHIHRRPKTLLWSLHEAAFAGLPITIIGHNDDMPGVEASPNWAALKESMSRHRFFVHTADVHLEDGYNMATLEAMAAGLPILGNRHPTSPVEHGVSGFLSDDPRELRQFAVRLLEDRPLAKRMGRAAQQAVAKKFSPEKFKAGLLQAIETARGKWLEHQHHGNDSLLEFAGQRSLVSETS